MPTSSKSFPPPSLTSTSARVRVSSERCSTTLATINPASSLWMRSMPSEVGGSLKERVLIEKFRELWWNCSTRWTVLMCWDRYYTVHRLIINTQHPNTVGAQNPNVFGFRMVESVPFMVPTIQKQNEKMTVRLDRFNLKKYIFFNIKRSRLVWPFCYLPLENGTKFCSEFLATSLEHFIISKKNIFT